MEYKEYDRKMEIINRQMDQISNLTANMTSANCANPSNPAFVSLMKNQDKLIKAADELIEVMQHQINSSNSE